MIDNARQSALNLNNASARMNDAMADFQRRDLLGRADAVLENARQVTEQLIQAVATFASSPAQQETKTQPQICATLLLVRGQA